MPIYSLQTLTWSLRRTYLTESARKASKSKNASGNPIKLASKILAVAADPENNERVYVAEAAGTVRRVVLEVCKTFSRLLMLKILPSVQFSTCLHVGLRFCA